MCKIKTAVLHKTNDRVQARVELECGYDLFVTRAGANFTPEDLGEGGVLSPGSDRYCAVHGQAAQEGEST